MGLRTDELVLGLTVGLGPRINLKWDPERGLSVLWG